MTLLSAACGSDGDRSGGADPTVPGRVVSTTTTAVASTSTAGATTSTTSTAVQRALRDVRARLTVVARLEAPTALASRPGSSSLYVTERAGRIRELRPRGAGFTVVAQPVLDVSSDTTTDGERGLLGLAFSADGRTLYASHTNAQGDTRLAAYRMVGGRADPSSRRVLLAVDQPYSNHNGGEVRLGPDGMLWFGLGDGGGQGDPDDRAQDPQDLLGKVLRIDPRRGSAGRPYTIPAGNPFASGGGRPEIFLTGVRNPWRFSFDRATGDLWIGDVGASTADEIDRLPAPLDQWAGANLGWSVYEASLPAGVPGRRLRGGRLVGPVYETRLAQGWCALAGGVVYRGSRLPALAGAYLFGDLCKTGINALRMDAGGRVAETAVIATGPPSVVAVDQDRQGEVYVVSLEGTVSRLDPG
ncbi:MAG: PQQ-dependent sugar dehydrogenase [Actinobacteria bacterium]|nr:PQQ-dependent sugar dehydrogenase [Actinomycetota bacterium]